jgi:hypothetical protein
VALTSLYGHDDLHGELSPEMHDLYESVFLQRRKINQRRHLPTSNNPVVLADDVAVEADTPVESPTQPVRKQPTVGKRRTGPVERRESLRDMASCRGFPCTVSITASSHEVPATVAVRASCMSVTAHRPRQALGGARYSVHGKDSRTGQSVASQQGSAGGAFPPTQARIGKRWATSSAPVTPSRRCLLPTSRRPTRVGHLTKKTRTACSKNRTVLEGRGTVLLGIGVPL